MISSIECDKIKAVLYGFAKEEYCRKCEELNLEELNINTSYGNIHVYKRGTGEKKIFLLHGSGLDGAMIFWWGVMKNFPENCTVYAPDLLGYGKSDKPDICGEDFYTAHIEALRETTEFLSIKRFYLAGISMGAAVALGYALKYPEQIQGLFPIAAWGLASSLPFHFLSYYLLQKTSLMILLFKIIGKSKWLVRQTIQSYLIGNKNKVTDKMVDEIRRVCREEDVLKAMRDFQRSSCDKKGAIPYYVQVLHKLKMPVIFIHGDKDPLVPVSDIYNIVNLCPKGKIYVLKGCKHWPIMEQPEKISTIIQENMKKQ